MTVVTFFRQISKYQPIKPLTIRHKMTLPAGNSCMLALEGERCSLMVEPDFIPGHNPVAIFTTGGGVIFRIDQVQVNIFVTIHTLFTNISETPLFLSSVTIQAGGGQVRPLQPEFRLVVSFDGKVGLCKAVNIVTIGTIGIYTIP